MSSSSWHQSQFTVIWHIHVYCALDQASFTVASPWLFLHLVGNYVLCLAEAIMHNDILSLGSMRKFCYLLIYTCCVYFIVRILISIEWLCVCVFRMLCLNAYATVTTHFRSVSGVRSLTRRRTWWLACWWLIPVAGSRHQMFSITHGSRTLLRSVIRCHSLPPNSKFWRQQCF